MPVLMLHGFPDDAATFERLGADLAGRGYRPVAPAMRGYPPGGAPPDGAYDLLSLAEDARAWLDRLGAPRAVVIGHDWGAAAGYLLAAMAPERVAALVAMAVPPIGALLRNLPRHPLQLWRSRYMLQAQLGEGLDVAGIEALWRRWSPAWPEVEAHLPRVRAVFGDLEVRRAALGYYRALRPGATPLPRWEATRKLAVAPIHVPTLVLCGARDGCLAPGLLRGAERQLRGPHEVVVVPNAGHFLHLERPHEVGTRIEAFLGRHAAVEGPTAVAQSASASSMAASTAASAG